MTRPHERQADPESVDAAITIWVFLGSIVLAIAAFLLYQSGHIAAGIALGIVSLVGVNINSVGYARWRKNRRKKGAWPK